MAIILTEEKMDKATRVIFKCGRKACKHVWAMEYTHKRYESLYRVENGNQVWRQEDYHCPKCGDECYVKATNVVGVYNEKHACNARCMSSTSGACSCSCGGANHGAGHLTVQEVIIEVEEPAKEETAVEAPIEAIEEPITEQVQTVADQTGVAASEVAKILAVKQEAEQGRQAEIESDAQELAARTGWIQKQEELQHMEKQETTPIINQIEQTVVASIEKGTIPDGVYVDRKYRKELQEAMSLVICGHDIGILYEKNDFMEGLPVMAYGIHRLAGETPEQETAYRHSFDGQRIFYYHRACVEDRLPEEVTFEQIPLVSVPWGTECEYCYGGMHEPPRYQEHRAFEGHPIQTATVIGEAYGVHRTTLTRAFNRGELKNAAYRSGDAILIDTSHEDWQHWLVIHEEQPRTKGYRKTNL